MVTRPAPDFSLLDQGGITRSLSDYSGNWIVLYFYPHDNSLNCTRESCTFRDEYRIVSQFGNAQIIGVNPGSVKSHKSFADKNHLNFPILSDTRHKVASAYGAWRSNKPALVDTFFGTRRNTYIIDPSGNIVKEYLTVNPKNHVQQVIADLHKLQETIVPVDKA